MGKTWWTVIPQGEDSVLLLDPDELTNGVPLIAFRRELDPRKEGCGTLKTDRVVTRSPSKFDTALLRAWKTFLRLRRGEIKPCVKNLLQLFSGRQMLQQSLQVNSYPPACANEECPICEPPVCDKAEPDVQKLRESINWLNNSLKEEPNNTNRINGAQKVVINDDRNIRHHLNSYISSGCCKLHLINFECQIRGLPWPLLPDISKEKDQLIRAVKLAQEKAIYDYKHC